MNVALMAQYIEFVADRLLVELGCEKVHSLFVHAMVTLLICDVYFINLQLQAILEVLPLLGGEGTGCLGVMV